MSLTLLAAGIATLGEARANAPRVVVAPLEVDGELAPEWVLDFEAQVAEGLSRADAELVFEDASPGCQVPDCWRDLARARSAAFVMAPSIAVRQRDFTVTIEIRSGADGRVAARTEQPCDLCGLVEVSDLIVDVAATVAARLDTLAMAKSVVTFESVPPGAMIVLDGEPIGLAPMNREVGAGRHRAEASLRNHVAQTRTFSTEPGIDEVLRFHLQDQPRDRKALRYASWTLVASGVTASVAGAVLLAIDERDVPSRCTGDNVNARGVCKYRYDTLLGGASLVGVGAAALLTGVALAIAFRRPRSQRVAVAPGGVTVRF